MEEISLCGKSGADGNSLLTELAVSYWDIFKGVAASGNCMGAGFKRSYPLAETSEVRKERARTYSRKRHRPRKEGLPRDCRPEQFMPEIKLVRRAL
jgi:hypothetical protein